LLPRVANRPQYLWLSWRCWASLTVNLWPSQWRTPSAGGGEGSEASGVECPADGEVIHRSTPARGLRWRLIQLCERLAGTGSGLSFSCALPA